LIVTSCLTLSTPYFTSGGHFSDLLRCSKVRQFKVAIVTLRSDQQGDPVDEKKKKHNFTYGTRISTYDSESGSDFQLIQIWNDR
jgi:hypothetical protein